LVKSRHCGKSGVTRRLNIHQRIIKRFVPLKKKKTKQNKKKTKKNKNNNNNNNNNTHKCRKNKHRINIKLVSYAITNLSLANEGRFV